MPKLSLITLFLLVFLVATRPALGDGINFKATGTYDSTTSSSSFSAPNTTFTITFGEPSTLPSLQTSVPIFFSLGSLPVFSGVGTVEFFPTTLGGLFDVDLLAGGDEYTWRFFGSQSYSGNSAPFTLLTGTFATMPPGSSSFFDANNNLFGTFEGAVVASTVVATSTVGSVPEPSSLFLLGAGLLGLGSLFRRQPVGTPGQRE